MKIKLVLTILALTFYHFSYAQQKYWRTIIDTGEYGSLNINFIVQEKNNYVFGTTVPNAHKRILGGIKSSLAKGMFEKDGSVAALDSISISNDSLTGYLLLQKKKYFLKGVKNQNLIVA